MSVTFWKFQVHKTSKEFRYVKLLARVCVHWIAKDLITKYEKDCNKNCRITVKFDFES